MTRAAPVASVVAEVFALGRVTEQPQEIDGGGVHRLWKLVTAGGAFAVKDLRVNPDDPEWLDRYLGGWRLERAAHGDGRVVMPARRCSAR